MDEGLALFMLFLDQTKCQILFEHSLFLQMLATVFGEDHQSMERVLGTANGDGPEKK